MAATRRSSAPGRPRRTSARPSAARATRARKKAAAPQVTVTTRDVGSGLAPGMQPISAYLAVASVDASIAFLERAFGFTRGVVLAAPGGETRYAEMRHGGAAVILVQKADAATPTSGMPALYTYVDDVDRQLAAAREAGAGVDVAADTAWGDRVATVTDPDGYRWVLATFKKLAPFT